jgi:hypothetical protein
MINAISPEFMNKIREVQNAGSPTPITPEIQQALDEAAGLTPPPSEQAPEETPPLPPPPTEEGTPQ